MVKSVKLVETFKQGVVLVKFGTVSGKAMTGMVSALVHPVAAYPTVSVTLYVPAVVYICVGEGLLVLSEKPSPKFQTNVSGVPREVLLKNIVSFVQTDANVKFAVGTGLTVTTFVMVSEQPLPPNEINVTLNVPAVAYI